MSDVFNICSRRQILKVGGSFLLGAVGSGSFPFIATLAAGRPKTVLSFRFTTKEGGKGFFYLDTATTPTSTIGAFSPEILYSNAVFSFSFSAPYINFKKQAANWKVVPGVTSNFLGLPSNLGVLGGVNYPSGCSTGTTAGCLITVAVLYSGNISVSPELSADPNSYPKVIGVDFFDPVSGQLKRDDAIYSSVNALPK